MKLPQQALDAGIDPMLVEEARASAYRIQSWGAFCLGWRKEIDAAGGEAIGLLLRDVHEAAYFELE